MNKNHQNKTESKLITTEDELWLPPLSPKDQKKVKHLQKKSFAERIGFAGKTPWDLVQLLIIPLVLLGVGSLFSYQQNLTSYQIVQEQQQEATLKTYQDDISDLLLNHNLSNPNRPSEVEVVARTQTLSALRRLNGARKGYLIQFLSEAGLINNYSNQNNVIIDLNGADLSGANLSGMNLRFAHLRDADLSGANLRDTWLAGAYLRHANLSNADLSNVDLSFANLYQATVTNEQLAKAKSLKDAIMPHLEGLRSTSLSYADLSNANLRGINLEGADLRHAWLTEADLSGADLSNANLSNANLYVTNLEGADLRHADLSNADLSFANLHQATVTNEQLAKARSLQGAVMPDGSKHP